MLRLSSKEDFVFLIRYIFEPFTQKTGGDNNTTNCWIARSEQLSSFWEHIREMNAAVFNKMDEDTIICRVLVGEW